ncbi:MAG TPA: DUF3310 domain-containing protein [Nitrososphaera sp.]
MRTNRAGSSNRPVADNTGQNGGKANERQVGGDHYQGASVQHWDFVLMHQIPYMEAQIIKYVMRWRSKDGIIDLVKAQHFLEKLIEWEKEQNE